MYNFISVLLISVLTANLYGCASNGTGSIAKQDVGVITGGVIGGLVGSRFGGGSGKLAAAAAGTLAGAVIGGAIGRNMDQTDLMQLNKSLENNSLGQPAYWTNERTGINYTVTPINNVNVHGNPYCREYRSVAFINGKRQQIYGTACRQPDGSWAAQ